MERNACAKLPSVELDLRKIAPSGDPEE